MTLTRSFMDSIERSTTALRRLFQDFSSSLNCEDGWVKIEGFERYLVNPKGQVYSTRAKKILKNGVESWGYEIVSLFNNGKGGSHKVHKLVAQAFLGPRPEGLQINHIDGVKTNNHISNLEYCTPKQNSQHAARTGLLKAPRGERHGQCKLSDKQIEEIRALSGQKTQQHVANLFGVSREHIRDIWNGKRRKEATR